ncbi:MAG TPA: hypothetical protein DCS97_04290, partial [Planctomycetes bacterium]|nr:hypothetical protein [Planctomycetota bacterium]
AEGDGDRAAALNRLVALEREVAEGLATRVRGAATRGDAGTCFTFIDQLHALARDARGSGPKEVVATLSVPFTVELDSRLAVLAINRNGAPAVVVRAPQGVAGAWRHPIDWNIAESLGVTVSRTGFAPQSFTISLAARRITAQIALVRGARWRVELGAGPASAPTLIPGAVLVGTNRATLEIIDPAQGVSRPVSFPDSVAEVAAAPAIFAGRCYLAFDDRLHAVDLGGRARLWSWPGSGNAERRRLTGHVVVAEHDLIQGQTLICAGAGRGEVLILAPSADGAVVVYPSARVGSEITGQLALDRPDSARSVLYVPAGTVLHAFDMSAVTERSPPAPLFTARTRGDLIGTPVPATVLGTPCLLISDASGLVQAIDRRPGVVDGKRIVASWAVDGTAPSTPTLSADGAFAFVATAEGRVQCLDLRKSGATRWRAPLKGGSLGSLVGPPALGRRGLYVADANGLLHSLDLGSGEVRWKADLGGAAIGGCLASDGRVIIPTRNGQVVCFEEGEE